MRILVCGSRDWTDYGFLCRILDHIVSTLDTTQVTIVQGDARGADKMAGLWARSRNIPCEVFPADWAKYGKSAGPRRNNQMLSTLSAGDWVVAFHNDITKSRGTAHTYHTAKRAPFPLNVRLYRSGQ